MDSELIKWGFEQGGIVLLALMSLLMLRQSYQERAALSDRVIEALRNSAESNTKLASSIEHLENMVNLWSDRRARQRDGDAE